MWEGSHHLRKADFPECADRTLKQLRTFFVRENSNNIPGLGGMTEEMATQIVEDFVFGQPWGKASRVPAAINELQVLELIIQTYQELSVEKVPDSVSYNLFQTLFGKAGSDGDRIHTLAKLISLAIDVECKLLLDSAALWMQLQGVHTSCVQLVIESLTKDFSSMEPSAEHENKLFQLPKISQHLACIFVSAVTTMCKFPGPVISPQSHTFYVHLLPMLTAWVSGDPRLCLISLFQAQHAQSLQSERSSLWTSPTKPNTHTPIPGLVRWCTQGPMNNLQCCHGNVLQFHGNHNPKLPGVKDNLKNEKKEVELDLLWSKLHLGVLQTLTAFPSLPGAQRLEVITLSDMKRLVDELVILGRKCEGEQAARVPLETGLDRMVQVVQVALATGAFRCSLADLKDICTSLPDTKLKSMLVGQHLSNNPPAMHNAS